MRSSSGQAGPVNSLIKFMIGTRSEFLSHGKKTELDGDQPRVYLARKFRNKSWNRFLKVSIMADGGHQP